MDSLEKAREAALRLIKFRPRSEKELRQRLAQKGFPSTTVDSLLAELKEKRLVNDTQFARVFVNDKLLLKPMGRQGLKAQLKAKGIDPSLASCVAHKALDAQEELVLARQLAHDRMSHLSGLNPQAFRRRLFGFLSRRGFAQEVVLRVVRESAAGVPHEE